MPFKIGGFFERPVFHGIKCNSYSQVCQLATLVFELSAFACGLMYPVLKVQPESPNARSMTQIQGL